MSEILLVLIAAFGALFGSAVSGFATYKAATIGFKRQQNQKQLFTALQDLQYMKEVEKFLLQRAAKNESICRK